MAEVLGNITIVIANRDESSLSEMESGAIKGSWGTMGVKDDDC